MTVSDFAAIPEHGKIENHQSGGNALHTPKKPPKVGDYVQWTSQGVERLPAPQKVVGIADGGEYAFVEGSDTGLPMSELTVVDPPADNASNPPLKAASSPPSNPFFKPRELDPPADLDDEKTNLDEGPVLLRWPKKISAESVEELEYWLEGVVRRARRKAGLSAEKDKKPADNTK